MGLDMYLHAKAYAYGLEWSKAEEKDAHRKLDAIGLIPKVSTNLDGFTVTREVAYWRKANAVHQWFVDQVQEGVDQCQTSYVPREKLIELRALCISLLEDKDETRAREELPPQEGFFFGGTEIDAWYWQDLQDTADQLGKILDNPAFDKLDFEYHASW